MARHDDAATYADLLARLGDDGTKELFRRLLEEALQELIDSVARHGPSGLDGFYEFAHSVVRPELDEMFKVVVDRVAPEVANTIEVLETQGTPAWVPGGTMHHTRTNVSAVLLPDGPGAHVAYVAAERAGLIVVGIGPRAGLAEVRHLLERTGASCLLGYAGFIVGLLVSRLACPG